MIKMVKCRSSELMAWRGEGGGDSVIFKGLANGSLTKLQEGRTWEEWEAMVIRVYCVKFPNNQSKYYVGKKESS